MLWRSFWSQRTSTRTAALEGAAQPRRWGVAPLGLALADAGGVSAPAPRTPEGAQPPCALMVEDALADEAEVTESAPTEYLQLLLS